MMVMSKSIIRIVFFNAKAKVLRTYLHVQIAMPFRLVDLSYLCKSNCKSDKVNYESHDPGNCALPKHYSNGPFCSLSLLINATAATQGVYSNEKTRRLETVTTDNALSTP